MVDIRERVREVLERGQLLSLGTFDEGGPWVSDVRYVSDDDLTIYWMSDPAYRHSKALEKEPRIGASVCVNYAYGTQNLGVQISGRARKLGILRLDLAVKYFTKRGKPAPAQAMHILKNGFSWYELVPESIDLIDEENFGYDKQRIVLERHDE